MTVVARGISNIDGGVAENEAEVERGTRGGDAVVVVL